MTTKNSYSTVRKCTGVTMHTYRTMWMHINTHVHTVRTWLIQKKSQFRLADTYMDCLRRNCFYVINNKPI